MTALMRTMFGELSPWGKFWLYVGFVALFAAAGMTFSVGWQMTPLHALFLACLSIVTAFAPETAYRMWGEHKRGAAVGISLLCMPLLGIEFFQHAAYTAGIRGNDIAETRVQNTRYDGAQDNVADTRRQMAFWEQRLASLDTQNGWAATVTAESLRAQLDSANKAIDIEAAKGGCKTNCLARMKERDALKARIAVLEEASDLGTKIEQARAKLENLRTAAATVEHKSSITEHMNTFLGRSVALVGYGSLKPSPMIEEATQQSANLALAFAGTGLPAMAFFMAGLFRLREDERRVSVTRTEQPANVATAPAPAPMAAHFHIGAAPRSGGPTIETLTIGDLIKRAA